MVVTDQILQVTYRMYIEGDIEENTILTIGKRNNETKRTAWQTFQHELFEFGLSFSLGIILSNLS